MNKSVSALTQTIGITAVITCGALLVGCAGNSPKSTASVEAEKMPEQTVIVEQQASVTPSIENEGTTSGSSTVDQPKDVATITAIESDQVALQQPEQLTFHFGFDKAELGDEDKEILKQHAQYLRANPSMIVKVFGHTDHNGPKVYNEYLSKKRAEAVSAVLIAEGVQGSQIEIKAMADEYPLETAQHARDNRRVELEFDEMNLVSK
jgi:peptidoglycan-associated lipoprotein